MGQSAIESDREAPRGSVADLRGHANNTGDMRTQFRGLRLAVAGIEDHELHRSLNGVERLRDCVT